MPIVVSLLKGFSTHVSGSFNLSLFLFNYTLETFQIDDFNIDPELTGVDLSKEDLNITLSDFTIDSYGRLGFTTDPELFFGKGWGMVNLTRLNSTVSIDFGKGENNLPTLKLKHSKVDINTTNVKAHFEGDNDVFSLLELAQNFSIPFIVDFLGGVMSDETRQTIEETVNGLLESLPDEIVIPGTHIAFNFGLLFSPKVTHGHVPFALMANASCINDTACKRYTGPKPSPPGETEVFQGKGSLQVLVSDYMLNTFCIAAWEDSMLKGTITPEMVHNLTNGTIELNTDLFGIFIPEMRQFYGPHRDITLDLELTAPPTIDITPKEITGIIQGLIIL